MTHSSDILSEQEAETMTTGFPDKDAAIEPAVKETNTVNSFVMKLLNGISIAVVVSLVPQALVGELAKALIPYWSGASTIIALVGIATALLPAIIGVLVSMEFDLTPIQTCCVSIAAVCGSGVVKIDPAGNFQLKGPGLVINAGLTAALAVGLILFIGPRLGSYNTTLLSTIVTVVAGGFGLMVSYPIVAKGVKWFGGLVNGATTLQPIVMGVVIAMIFGLVILSPVSTVGIATAIFMDGIASGTGNLGVVAAAVIMMVFGWRVNGFATSVLHVLGSPKIQMANIYQHPAVLVPVLISAGILGGIGGFFGISGTPISAGFGLSGFVGPMAALNYDGWGWTAGNMALVFVLFFILPVVLAFIMQWIFVKKLGWTKPEYLKIDFK